MNKCHECGCDWDQLEKLVREWRENANAQGDRSPWTATTYGQCAFLLEKVITTASLPEAVAGNASAPVGEKRQPSGVGEPQDFNAKFGGDIYVVTGEHQRTAFFSKAAAEQYLAKQNPERFKIVVYAKPVGEQRELTAEQAEKIDEIISRHKTDEFDSFHAADDLSDYLFGGVNYPGIFAEPREVGEPRGGEGHK